MAVRCCANDGSSCQSGDGAGGSCIASATYTDAEAICDSYGMRLCTQVELQSGLCCSTGCNFDDVAVWTATPCGSSSSNSVSLTVGSDNVQVSPFAKPATCSGRCLQLTSESACPGSEGSLVRCDDGGLSIGDKCEGDFELATDNHADNCQGTYDVYELVSVHQSSGGLI